jgi:hypothetical protein
MSEIYSFVADGWRRKIEMHNGLEAVKNAPTFRV